MNDELLRTAAARLQPVLTWQTTAGSPVPATISAGASWLQISLAERPPVRIRGPAALAEAARVIRELAGEIATNGTYTGSIGGVVVFRNSGSHVWIGEGGRNESIPLDVAIFCDLHNWLGLIACYPAEPADLITIIELAPGGDGAVRLALGSRLFASDAYRFACDAPAETARFLLACAGSMEMFEHGSAVSHAHRLSRQHSLELRLLENSWYELTLNSTHSPQRRIDVSRSTLARLALAIGHAAEVRDHVG